MNHYHLYSEEVTYLLTQLIYQSELLSTFTILGLITLIGVLLGEYSTIHPIKGYYRAEITPKTVKRRKMLWGIFAFLLVNAIMFEIVN